MADKSKKLTPKQTLFIQEYLIDLNATQAAIRAGYSKKTSFTIGVENLTKPLISQAIQAELKKRVAKIERTGTEVIKRLWTFSDIDKKNYFDKGATKATELLAKHLPASILGIL